MTLAEIVVMSGAVVSCVGICAGAYYLSENNKAVIQQRGISERAALRTPSTEGQKQEWYIPILVELMKQPQVISMITSKLGVSVPGIMEQPKM